MDDAATSTTKASPDLPTRIVDEVVAVVQDAEEASKPLEIDPYRGRLFELFVTADAAGYIDDCAELSSDGLCHQLSQRWDLRQAAEQSIAEQSRLGASQLQKMRSLWSVMRMWMEWSYAWSRWDEFHRQS